MIPIQWIFVEKTGLAKKDIGGGMEGSLQKKSPSVGKKGVTSGGGVTFSRFTQRQRAVRKGNKMTSAKQ